MNRFKEVIKIELDNNNISNFKKGEYEFTTGVLLKGLAANSIAIPLSLIVDDEMDKRRVAIFSYLRCCCGIDNISRFTIPSIVEWCGHKPDKGAKGINNKFLDVIDALNDRGYLTYLNNPSRTTYMECEFDINNYNKECKNGFAIIYLDEIQKILSYKKSNLKNTQLTNATILLVFAYLRAKIYRRPNKLRHEEKNIDGTNNHIIDIKNRRYKFPEAYNDSLNSISDKIGVSEKTLSKTINILENELKLITTDKAYRIKNEKGEFRTLHTIFANTYKREGKYVLASGDEYSKAEIEIKAKRITEDFNIDYKIDKRKRK